MIKKVTNKVEIDILKENFFKVFKDKNPFDEMFSDLIQDRIILCPIEGYQLDKSQYNALLYAMENVGDAKFYISEVEVQDCFSIPLSEKYYPAEHWNCNLPITFQEYNSMKMILENAIYSPNGKWGVLISHEDHAVIGGTGLFMESFKEAYPNWENGLTNFLRIWENNKTEYNSDVTWIPKLINHIYRNKK